MTRREFITLLGGAAAQDGQAIFLPPSPPAEKPPLAKIRPALSIR